MKFIMTEEQYEKFNQKVKSVVEKYGIEHAIKLFGDKGIIRRAYSNNPLEFLEQFNDLIPVEKDDKIFYVDKDRLPLFYYFPDEKNGYVFIDYHKIWMFFYEVIGLEHPEIQEIIKNWLEETYNLKGLTPEDMHHKVFFQLEETYNLKGLTPRFLHSYLLLKVGRDL